MSDTPNRWRARKSSRYYCVDDAGQVFEDRECGHEVDDDRWKVGNYFRHHRSAAAAGKAVRKVIGFIVTGDGTGVVTAIDDAYDVVQEAGDGAA